MFRCLVAAAWLLLFGPTLFADEPSPANEKYQALLKEYDEVRRARDFAPKFLEFAEQHSKDAAAFDALVWVVSNLQYRPEITQALGMLQKQHLENERLAGACRAIGRSTLPAAEKLLRAALDKSPHAAVRAQACFHLAALLEQQTSLTEKLKKEPELKERGQQYYGRELSEHLATLDVKQVEQQREKLYEQMRKSFADVAIKDTTMGDFAEKALFAIRHLSVGKVAPEITGEDIDGKKFKLSDYRGKVVMLSYWGHW